MSPVWIMSAGLSGVARTLSTAALKVARASGLAGFSKPMWLSEIWTKEKPLSAAFAEPISREEGTPPATVHTTPVPAHSMHFRVCRRSGPPMLSFAMDLSSIRRRAPVMEKTRERSRLFPGREKFGHCACVTGRRQWSAANSERRIMPVTPFPPGFHTQDIETDGATIHIRVGGQGPTVVLLHGFGDTGDMWALVAAALASGH